MPADPTAKPRKSQDDINHEIGRVIRNLNDEWDLGLPLPEEVASPSKRGTRKEILCFNMINFLTCEDDPYPTLKDFNTDANKLWSGWVHKPNADRDLLPARTRLGPKTLNGNERAKLLHVLYTLLKEKSDPVRDARKSFRQPTFESRNSKGPKIDDSPLPFPKLQADHKRSREEPVAFDPIKTKKAKPPDKGKEVLSQKAANAMAPPPRGRPVHPGPKISRSANTSFESNTSSIFSNSNFSRSMSMLPNTQETIPDVEEAKDASPDPSRIPQQEEQNTSSDFGVGSSFEAALAAASDPNALIQGSDVALEHVEEKLSQGLLDFGIDRVSQGITPVDVLQDRLAEVFPQLPQSLNSASFRVKYEILRVFLQAGVAFTGVNFPSPALLDDYEGLWRFLKHVRVLKEKPLPEKSEKAAWEAAKGGFNCADRVVVLSGSLKFDGSNATGPLYRFKLKPLKLDLSYRLSCRLGSDRFLEIDMPHLTDPGKTTNGYPQLLRDLGERGIGVLLDWLVDSKHSLLGRYWQPFSTKPKEKRGKKREDPSESETAHCVYFFAVDSPEFGIVDGQPGISPKSLKMSIASLLDTIRLTRKNVHQPFLKLFSRTSIALSKTTPTVVLEPHQIKYMNDIKCGSEDMTDGAGQMSRALAERITEMYGLPFRPSGFQGRIGPAKGFWSIDFSDTSDTEWIAVYKSQRKWEQSKAKRVRNQDMDPSNRTFEVLNPSRPLKAADLNLQLLPLLIEQAENPRLMKETLANILRTELNKDLDLLISAMDNPRSLRKWTGERNPNFRERLKAGLVPFRAGLPISLDEQLNLFLDVGFEPKQMSFVAEIAKKLFFSRCDELKTRLNMPVSKSAYAYMVPDFAGVLEPGEVQINVSNFMDKSSGFSAEILSGQELLVARSPAHFVSDVQKVKAVWKEELMRLKDVIIFSTKGKPGDRCPSLAQKLSGGDFDGDMAWVCWEPAIVNNFKSVEVPEAPDLVELGYLRKDSTTYADLTKEATSRSEKTSLFLKQSFLFNMRQSMLGICTNYKEKVCYTQRSVATPQAMQLSTLLSCLVDSAKQGYSFDQSDFERFKHDLILPHVKPREPEHSKKDHRHLTEHSEHIVDYLMFVAETTVEACLTKFHNSFPGTIPHWDDDLETPYKWAKTAATEDKVWVEVLRKLDEDLRVLKKSWGDRWQKAIQSAKGVDKVPAAESLQITAEHFEMYNAIQPCGESSSIASLLLGNISGEKASNWSLLKASTFFASFSRRDSSPLPWRLAGRQLAQIKANCNGLRPMIDSMYVNYKPDGTFIKRFIGSSEVVLFMDDEGVSNVDELEASQAQDL